MRTSEAVDISAKQNALSYSLFIMFMFLFGLLTVWSALFSCPDRKLIFMHYRVTLALASRMFSLGGDVLIFLMGFNYLRITKIFRTKILIAVLCLCVALAMCVLSVGIILHSIKIPTVLLGAYYIIERLGLLIVVLFIVSGIDTVRVKQLKENGGNL